MQADISCVLCKTGADGKIALFPVGRLQKQEGKLRRLRLPFVPPLPFAEVSCFRAKWKTHKNSETACKQQPSLIERFLSVTRVVSNQLPVHPDSKSESF